MKTENFTNEYLLSTRHGAALAEIMAAAISAVTGEKAVRRNLRLAGDELFIGESVFDLRLIKRLFVVGAGKAGAAMAKAAHEILGANITAGLIIVKDGHSLTDKTKKFGNIEILEAAHPVPDERGVFAAKKLALLISDLTAEDLILVLISGGGSALTCLPAGDVRLADLQNLTDRLLRGGARIEEINCLRKHLTGLSGGGLARLAHPARICSLIVSDVVGSPLT